MIELDVESVMEREFRGAKFKHAKLRDGTKHSNASWFTFDDEQEVRDRWWHILPGERVLDIGAAFGSYALPALALGAEVVCFSPADFDTALLERNIALNPDFAERCAIVRDGLYSRTGYFDPDHCRFIDDATMNGTTVSEGDAWLRVVALDDFFGAHPNDDSLPDLIKMDVEGAELEVLKGGVNLLRACKPSLLIELHEFHDADMPKKVAAFLAELGYTQDGPRKHHAVSHAFFSARGK